MGVMVTAGVSEECAKVVGFNDWIIECMYRSFRGDFGDCCREDTKLNKQAYKAMDGSRTLAVYKKQGFNTIWIISYHRNDVCNHGTDGMYHCNETTILFPEEY